MKSKTDQVRELVAAGAFKEALKIAKTFRIGISQQDKLAIALGYECIVHPAFYQQLGKCPTTLIQEAQSVMQRLYSDILATI
jgi:hypothetical protein